MDQVSGARLSVGWRAILENARLPRAMVWVATIVFMASYFITKGPVATDANLINLTYLEVATMAILLAVRHYLWRDDVLSRSILIAFPIFLLLATHVLLVNDGKEVAYMTKLVRLYGYLVMVALFVCCFFEWWVFFRALYWFSLISVMFAVFTALFFPQYFSDLGYGFPRARALLSEPSAFGPIIPLLFYYSVYKRNWPEAVLSLIAVNVAASGTVYFVLVLTGALLLARVVHSSRYRYQYLFLFAGLLGAVFVLHGQIHHFMSGIFNYDRSIGQIQAVADFGGSTRLSSLFNYGLLFHEEGGLWFGKGLNAATVFFAEVPYEQLYMVSEFSLLHAVFFAFGLTGLLLLFILLVYSLAMVWQHGTVEMLIVFSCFMFASLLNSSGGHVLYKFVYVFILLALQRAWQMRTPGRKSMPLNGRGCRTYMDFSSKTLWSLIPGRR